eukprot:3932269-Rhodomonas_salina.3
MVLSGVWFGGERREAGGGRREGGKVGVLELGARGRMFKGSGFRVPGSGLRIQGSGFRVLGLGFGGSGSGRQPPAWRA